jgi:hypothetical protein
MDYAEAKREESGEEKKNGYERSISFPHVI